VASAVLATRSRSDQEMNALKEHVWREPVDSEFVAAERYVPTAGGSRQRLKMLSTVIDHRANTFLLWKVHATAQVKNIIAQAVIRMLKTHFENETPIGTNHVLTFAPISTAEYISLRCHCKKEWVG